MIKKKFLYILIITGILIGPIMYWMNTWWGVNFHKFPSIGVFRYIFSQDKFLLIVSSVNASLYVLALVRILTLKESHKNTVNESNGQAVENPVSFLNNTSQEDIAKWENLYGNNVSNQVKPAKETVMEKPVNDVVKTVTETKVDIAPQPVQPETQVAPQAPSVQSEVIPQNTPKENNVVDMSGMLSARDVYKNMIDDVLIDAGYVDMGAQVIANTDIDFVAIAESDTLVVGIISTETGEIIANEVSNAQGETPSWFTNEHKFPSPVGEIKNVANMIQNMINEVLPEDNGILIKPVVVIPSATVSNYADIKAKWEEIGVDVVRFMNRSDLPNLIDVLPDKSGTEVLESYKNFVNTLMKYFNKKAKKSPIKKVG